MKRRTTPKVEKLVERGKKRLDDIHSAKKSDHDDHVGRDPDRYPLRRP